MRAKNVNEYNFKRGIEPSDAMGTGSMNYWVFKGVLLQSVKPFYIDDVTRVITEGESSNDKVHTFAKDSAVAISKSEFIPRKGMILFDGYIVNGTQDPTNNQYRDLYTNFWGLPSVMSRIFRIINTPVKESLEFKRNIEPADAMNIGKTADDRDFIKETDWSLNVEITLEKYEIVELIRNYKGYPILLFKEKENFNEGHIPFYRAISTFDFYVGDLKSTPKAALNQIKHFIDHGMKRSEPIPESVNYSFHRGMEPKTAMETGDEQTMQKEKAFLKFLQENKINFDFRKMIKIKNKAGQEVRVIGFNVYSKAYGARWDEEIQQWKYTSWFSNGQEFSKVYSKFGLKPNDAREVYRKVFLGESIDFKRGVEPKDSMNTGVDLKKEHKYEIEIKCLTRDCIFFQSPIITKDAEGREARITGIRKDDYLLFGFTYYDDLATITVDDKIINSGTWEYCVWNKTGKNEMYAYGGISPEVAEAAYNKPPKLRESLDFKRGLEPKEAMSTGADMEKEKNFKLQMHNISDAKHFTRIDPPYVTKNFHGEEVRIFGVKNDNMNFPGELIGFAYDEPRETWDFYAWNQDGKNDYAEMCHIFPKDAKEATKLASSKNTK